jgi:hypothetical protein
LLGSSRKKGCSRDRGEKGSRGQNSFHAQPP